MNKTAESLSEEADRFEKRWIPPLAIVTFASMALAAIAIAVHIFSAP